MFLRRGRKPEVKTYHSWCSLYVCGMHNLVLSIKMTTVQSIHWRQRARELALFFFRLLFAFPERHCPSSLVTVKKTTFSYFLIFASTFSWNFQVWRSTFITWSSEGAATQNHLEIGDEITNIGSQFKLITVYSKPLATEEEIRNNAYGTQLWDRWIIILIGCSYSVILVVSSDNFEFISVFSFHHPLSYRRE